MFAATGAADKEAKVAFALDFGVRLATGRAEDEFVSVLSYFVVDAAGRDFAAKKQKVTADIARCCEFFEQVFEHVLRRSSQGASNLMEIGDYGFVSLEPAANFWNFEAFFFEDALGQLFACACEELFIIHECI